MSVIYKGGKDSPFEVGGEVSVYFVFSDADNHRFFPEKFPQPPTLYDAQGNQVKSSMIVTPIPEGMKMRVSIPTTGLVPGQYVLKAVGEHQGVEYPIEGYIVLEYEGVKEALIRMEREYMFDQDPSLYRFEVFDRNKHLWNLNQIWIAIEMTFETLNSIPWVTDFKICDEQGNEGFPSSWLPFILEGASIQLLESRAILEVANTLMDSESSFQLDRSPRYLAIASQKRSAWREGARILKTRYVPMARGSRSYRIPAGFMIRQLGLRLDLQDIFASSTNPSVTTFYTSMW